MILLALVAVLVVAGLALYLYGRSQPERHTAAISFSLPRPRATVWAALTDYAAMPKWWPAVQGVRFETRAHG